MIYKITVFAFILLFFISCRSGADVTAHSQINAETNVNTHQSLETNVETYQSSVNNYPDKTDTQTFAKAFSVSGRFDDSKATIVYTDHLIEFKTNGLKGISVYVDGEKKASLSFQINEPKVRADFLDSDGERYFIVVTGSRLTGTCGDESFVIVKINDDLNVKMSKPNESDCQGELYPVKIENVNLGKSKGSYRQISIGDLKFNLDSFEWLK